MPIIFYVRLHVDALLSLLVRQLVALRGSPGQRTVIIEIDDALRMRAEQAERLAERLTEELWLARHQKADS